MAVRLEMTKLQAKVLEARKSRSVTALSLFRPTEQQEPFLRQFAIDGGLEYLVGGGNRCLHGSQEIYDPVANVSRRVDEIDGEFHVNSVNPATGKTEVKRASRPFVKGYGELWQVTMSSGEVIKVTPEHRVVARDGTWVSIREAWEQQIPLASVRTCEFHAAKDGSSVRSTGHQAGQPSASRSLSSASPEVHHRSETGNQFRCVAQGVEESPSHETSCAGVRQPLSSRTSRRFLQQYVCSTGHAGLPIQEECGWLGTLPAIEVAHQVGEVPCEPYCGYSQNPSQSDALIASERRICFLSQHLQGSQTASFREGALHCSQTIPGWKYRCDDEPHRGDAPILMAEGNAQCAAPLRGGVLGHSRFATHVDGRASTAVCSLTKSSNARLSIDEGGEVASSICKQDCGSRRTSQSGRRPSFLDSTSRLQRFLEPDVFQASHPLLFEFDDDVALVTVVSVASLGESPIWDITVEDWSNYTFHSDSTQESVVSANSGKSVIAAVVLAAICLGVPVTMRDGTQLQLRPPRWQSEALKCWVVSINWAHAGKTIFRLLFKPNLFRVIRDQKTGKWRAFDPTNPEDAGSYHLTRPSPALIRSTDVAENSMSWENKKERQLSSCELAHDGTRIEFFASTGEMPQGDPAHLIWVDERLDNDAWISELLIRLVDHRGRFMWTSWPTTAPSAALTELEERAALQLGKPDAKSFYFRFKGSDNPHTQSDHRKAILETMDEDTRLARDDGIMNPDRWRVYPRFSRFMHRVLGPDPEGDDELAKVVRKLNGIPQDWTRYLILDPGHANPAVLFVAIPPPKLGNYIVPYDEIYMHYKGAEETAEGVAAKCGVVKGKHNGLTPPVFFEDFIVDSHGARITPMGFKGTTVGENYEKAFAACNLRCRRHGSRFSFGTDNVDGRIMQLQGAMNVGENGFPRLRILGCPNLVKQLEHYKWKKDPKGNPTDKPDDYQKIDLAQCCEYLVSREDCGYVKPPVVKQEDATSFASVMAGFKKIMGIEDRPKDGSVYCGPGVAPQY